MLKNDNLGDVDSLFDLANKYAVGNEVQKDIYKAINYFKLAAAKGDIESLLMLGVAYDQIGNSQEAFKYYFQAAENGNLKAQFDLSICFFNGEGVGQDHSKGLYWLKRAASGGHAQAINVMRQNNLT